MKRWRKWGGLTLALGIVVGLAGRAVISQQPPPTAPLPPPAPPMPPTVTPAALGTLANHLWEPLRPHLEAVLGAPLEAVPQIRTVTTAQLSQVADADLDAHLRWHFPQLRGDTLTATRRVARQIVASSTIAQYVEGSDTILVVPEALPRIAHWDESLAAVDSPAVLQLALVHETARFLLDRRYHLTKLRAACRDGEEHQALLAVVEGRAQQVTRQVAVRLGQEKLFPLLAQRYLRVPDEAPDSGLRAVSQTALRQRHKACVQGENFYSVLADAGLRDAEQRVFGRLPRQQRTIERPDLWLRALDQNRPDLAGVLESLESALPAEEWQPFQQTWTPAMLAQVAGLLGTPRERVDKVAASWDEGRTLLWSHRQHPERQVALSVVRHDKPAGARTYFGFAVDLQRKQDTLTPGNCGPAIRVLESQSSGMQLEGFDEAVRNDKSIQYGDAAPVAVHLLLARAGDLVVECTWYGAGTEPALAERLAQAVRMKSK
jgi:hypothetical protein